MKKYLKILALIYLFGGILHIFDIFDLRLKFSELSTIWKILICYLATMDLIAAWGLWKQKKLGIFCFLLVALSQLFTYLIFKDYFGPQYSLIVFHLSTLIIYSLFQFKNLNHLKKWLDSLREKSAQEND